MTELYDHMKHLTNDHGDCVEWCPVCEQIKIDEEDGILPHICNACSAQYPARCRSCTECGCMEGSV
jgi:hypothetical protein